MRAGKTQTVGAEKSFVHGQESKAMTLAYNLCNEDLTFQSVRCGKSEPGELLTTAFGDLTQSKDLRSCVLRVLEEVKEGAFYRRCPAQI